MNQLTVKVVQRIDECEDIAVFELRDPQGRDLEPFTAGAHVDVHLPDGLVRQYSLCNAPSERHRYLLGVLHAPQSRGGSRAMHAGVTPGSTLRISAPRNSFPLAQAQRSLLLAGGIGITPLLCMAEHLSAAGAAFELHYSARSRQRAAFLGRLADAAYAPQVHCYFDDAPQAGQLQLAALLGTPDPGTHLYICGPAGYIDFVQGFAVRQGWAPGQIHIEHFGAAAPAPGVAQSTFRVRIHSTGLECTVGADQSIVEALAVAGVQVPVSCEQGICGTCVTRVLQGVPDHRDMFLTDQEHARNDQMTPCCSRALSDLLVLDL